MGWGRILAESASCGAWTAATLIASAIVLGMIMTQDKTDLVQSASRELALNLDSFRTALQWLLVWHFLGSIVRFDTRCAWSLAMVRTSWLNMLMYIKCHALKRYQLYS